MEDGSDEMFCPSCGERMRRSANFCSNCGEPNRKQDGVDWGPAQAGGGGPDAGGRDTRRGTTSPPDAAPQPGPNRAPASGRGPQPGPNGAPASGGGAPPGPNRAPAPGRGPPPGRNRAPADTEGTAQWRNNLPDRVRQLPEAGWRVAESWWRVVGIAIGLGVLGLILLAIISLIVGGITAAVGLSVGVALVVGTVIGQLLGFMGLSLWYLRQRGLDWDRVKEYLGIRRPTLKQVGLIFGAWIALLIGMVAVGGIGQVLLDFLGAGDASAEQESTQIFADNPELLPLGIAMMFLVVGPSEEILFRGVIQGRLRERFSALTAIAVTAVFFASIHAPGFIGSLQGIVLGVSVLVVGGVVFGAVYEYTENLVVVALLHGFHNSMILVFIYVGEVTDVQEESVLSSLAAVPLPF
jgi:membrane protease YdiL (CAAX protease family)